MAKEVILYQLDLSGNMPAKLAELPAKLEKTAAAAQKTTAAVATTGTMFERLGAASKTLQQSSMVSEAETVSALFIQLGGNISRVASVTTSLIRPVAIASAVFGGATLAAAGFGAALLAIPAAYYKIGTGLASAADEAEQRLRKLGQAARMDPSAVASLAEYRAAQRELSITTDALRVKLGEGFIDEITNLVTLMTDLADGAIAAADAFSGLNKSLPAALLTGGGSILGSKLKSSISSALSSQSAAALDAQHTQSESDRFLKQLASTFPKILTEREILEADAERAVAEGARQQALADAADRRAEEAKRRADREAQKADKAERERVAGAIALDRLAELPSQLGPLAPAMTEMVEALQGLPDKMAEALRVLRLDAAAERATGLLGAAQGGAGSLIGSFGGPWGALIGAAISGAGTFGSQGEEPGWAVALMDQLATFPETVVEQSQAFFAALPEQISKGITHSGAILSLPIAIVTAFIAESPAIFAALIEAIVTGPLQIVASIKEAFASLPEDLGKAIREAFTGLPNRIGDRLGIHLGAEARASGQAEFLGLSLPSFDRFSQSSGEITRSGLAMVHRGESIGPGRSNSVSIGQIHLHGVQDPQRFVEQLRSRLGTRGLGFSLEPYGGVG